MSGGHGVQPAVVHDLHSGGIDAPHGDPGALRGLALELPTGLLDLLAAEAVDLHLARASREQLAADRHPDQPGSAGSQSAAVGGALHMDLPRIAATPEMPGWGSFVDIPRPDR